MSPIKPHGPVQPDPSGLPVSPREKGDDTPFDGYLPDQSSTGTPTPIAQNPPPATGPEDPRNLDPMKGIMPRPIRWKDGKNPASGSLGADVMSPVVALPTPIDPQLAATAIAVPQSWTLLAPPSHDTDASPTDGDLAQSAPGAEISNAGLTATNDVSIPNMLPGETLATGMIRRMKVDGSSVSADPASTMDLTAANVVARQAESVDVTTTAQALSTPVLASPVAASAVPLSIVADSSATPLAMDLRAVDVGPASPLPPGTNVSLTTPTTGLQPALGEVALPLPTSRDLSPPALTDSRVALVSVAVPATVAFSAANAQVEISASVAGDRAKIAGSAMPESKSARKSEDHKTQVAGNEQLISDVEFDGTPVARDEPIVNAVLNANEKETEASPRPKRVGAPVPGMVGDSRTGTARPTVGETLVNAAVSGPASVDATATAVTQSPTPEPTATRQAVQVETLLQHTLSAGESVRPNGTDQMEMRVRLDGGHEDVLVQMQVVNDRMQVTFQTNSPELRKALEHGWEQFSGNAAQTSTLSMSEPRFEASRVNTAPPNAQADTPSFSSNQQNPRRQETAATFGDELAPSVAFRRADLAATPALAPAAGQSAVRRWSGWA